MPIVIWEETFTQTTMTFGVKNICHLFRYSTSWRVQSGTKVVPPSNSMLACEILIYNNELGAWCTIVFSCIFSIFSSVLVLYSSLIYEKQPNILDFLSGQNIIAVENHFCNVALAVTCTGTTHCWPSCNRNSH